MILLPFSLLFYTSFFPGFMFMSNWSWMIRSTLHTRANKACEYDAKHTKRDRNWNRDPSETLTNDALRQRCSSVRLASLESREYDSAISSITTGLIMDETTLSCRRCEEFNIHETWLGTILLARQKKKLKRTRSWYAGPIGMRCHKMQKRDKVVFFAHWCPSCYGQAS